MVHDLLHLHARLIKALTLWR
ncbi:hypothetical protein V12B01_12700 [Vibrio splendidus 12B01]|nr:hypothetical protein V12B01_12700 [Vibrio splendidus 12B01]EAQ54933.1 hypothetical protein MED222_04945 [Vibrio sp. MED222]